MRTKALTNAEASQRCDRNFHPLRRGLSRAESGNRPARHLCGRQDQQRRRCGTGMSLPSDPSQRRGYWRATSPLPFRSGRRAACLACPPILPSEAMRVAHRPSKCRTRHPSPAAPTTSPIRRAGSRRGPGKSAVILPGNMDQVRASDEHPATVWSKLPLIADGQTVLHDAPRTCDQVLQCGLRAEAPTKRLIMPDLAVW